jgi:hypothetical protein
MTDTTHGLYEIAVKIQLERDAALAEVEHLRAQVTTLQAQVTTLQAQVTTLRAPSAKPVATPVDEEMGSSGRVLELVEKWIAENDGYDAAAYDALAENQR